MAAGHRSLEGPSKHDAQLFIDPIIGSPLHFYVHEDVKDRDAIVEVILARGGNTTSNYSTATYILVDPKEGTDKALWRLHSNNKRKVILDAEWIWACIRHNSILSLGHSNDWGGFKIKETEQQTSGEGPSVAPPIVALNPEGARHALTPPSTPQPQVFSQDVTPSSSQESQNPFVLDHNSGSFLLPSDINDPASTLLSQIFAPNTFSNLHGSWTADHNLDFGHGHDFGANLEYAPLWDEHGRSFNADMNANDTHPFSLSGQETFAKYYFDSQVPTPEPELPASNAPFEADAAPLLPPSDSTDVPRPLKRKDLEMDQPGAPPSPVIEPLPPERRSPTPPTRAVSSTHGGNVFTDEDVAYLHKYIAYCKDIGSVLSLREICERLAVKAPHHTFFSWRRYCNKHKIPLGGYNTDGALAASVSRARDLNATVSDSPCSGDISTRGMNTPTPIITLATEVEEHGDAASQSSIVLIAGTGGRLRYRNFRSKTQDVNDESHQSDEFYQDKEPEAPRSLYRSKTGKGIAFTRADVDFLVRYISFRRYQGLPAASEAGKDKDDINMTRLWTDIVEKLEFPSSERDLNRQFANAIVNFQASHHSRASWVKFWRRHKHVLEFAEDSLPPRRSPLDKAALEAPDVSHGCSIPVSRKRQRYSRADDILIARYFASRSLPTTPTLRAKGESRAERETSRDAIFREFALAHPQHPWKGWQEHYRMHKAEIERLVAKIDHGEEIE